MTDPKPCPFCPIEHREILAEHPPAAAITDCFPLTQGHTLIVPRRHVASFFELTMNERAPIYSAIQALNDRIAKFWGRAGRTPPTIVSEGTISC